MRKYLRKFNKKSKIIIIVAITILSMGIGYYAYSKENYEFETSNFEKENQINSENENLKTKKQEEKIIVHISGAVKSEGVIELEEDSRVSDAIEKAGGYTEEAYTKEINLASKLEDGMKIYIPTKKEIEEQNYVESDGQVQTSNNTKNKPNIGTQAKSNSTTLSGQTQSNAQNKQSTAKVNINTATKEQLDTLPGIGSSTADKILQYRKENGKFKTKEDIKKVSGIGESKYNKIKDLIEI